MKKLAIILPCYNEEEVLKHSIKKISTLLKNLIKNKLVSDKSYACFVDDGSTDQTLNILIKESEKNKLIKIINLSRNFGHQNAILSGMYNCNADLYVTIDADLQDDINVIKDMIIKANDGAEIVYGIRKKRQSDNFFKKITAMAYYKILKIIGVKIHYNHADFRLLSKKAIETLKEYNEKNLFLRAVVPLVGYKSDTVYYDRIKREYGKTKYNLPKMLALAWDGITSFSAFPLRLVTITGFLVCFLSFLFALRVLYFWHIGFGLKGWTTIVTLITFFGGLQLVSIGIIGEYIAKIFIETKQRPLYIIDKKIGFNEKNI